MTEKIDTGFKKVQIVSSLVASHKSEVDLEYYLSFLDKHGTDFFEKLTCSNFETNSLSLVEKYFSCLSNT